MLSCECRNEFYVREDYLVVLCYGDDDDDGMWVDFDNIGGFGIGHEISYCDTLKHIAVP